MAIMVTGTGFLGSYVARDLLAQGEEVVLYGYFGGQGEPASLDLSDLSLLDHLVGGDLFEKVMVEVGDITDGAALRASIEKHAVTGVIHLAGMVGVASETHPPQAIQVNSVGTANVFQAAVDLNVSRVVWASSVTVFGPRSIGSEQTVSDFCMVDPQSVYGATKVFNESLARRYYENHGLNVVGLRPNRVYGYGEHAKAKRGSGSGWFFDALYNSAVESGLAQWPFGDKSLDFHYVEDVADAFTSALRSTAGSGDSYLIGGDFRPIKDAYSFLSGLLPKSDLSLTGTPEDLPKGSSSIWTTRPDTRRAADELGITSKTTMEEGLLRTVNGYRADAGLTPVVGRG